MSQYHQMADAELNFQQCSFRWEFYILLFFGFVYKHPVVLRLRACLHGGRGPQVGEVRHLGG